MLDVEDYKEMSLVESSETQDDSLYDLGENKNSKHIEHQNFKENIDDFMSETYEENSDSEDDEENSEIESEDESKPYKCDYCEGTFSKQEFLDRHRAAIHKRKNSHMESMKTSTIEYQNFKGNIIGNHLSLGMKRSLA